MLSSLPIEKVLRRALKNGGDFSDIFYETTRTTSIFFDNGRIEKILTGIDAGIGIRVMNEGNTAYGCSNDISERSLFELAETVSRAVSCSAIAPDKINLLSRRSAPPVSRIEIEPADVALDIKTGMINSAGRLALGFDKRILQASIQYKDATRSYEIANSLGELIEDHSVDSVLMVAIIAADRGVIQTGYESIGASKGFELFEENPPEDAVKRACTRAIMMLSARHAPAGTMPVVLSSEAGGAMIHEAVGHGLEADLVLSGFSVYKNQLGQKVASPLITVVDDATMPGRRGSFTFDDEGIHSERTILIENGILKSYMHNRQTAKKAGVRSTGNGRRESYRFKPSVRMTNTFIAPGTDDPPSIIRDTPNGLFVKKMGGGQVNTVTGDFVFEAQEAYLIRNGNISEPVRGATLTGNGPEVLLKIDRVGSDLGFAIGTCGKDGQAVPVGNAQPTIRIPELVVGGTD